MQKSLTHIVSQNHAQRIKNLLDATHGKIVFGGESDVENRFIGLTVVQDVQEGDSLLSELSYQIELHPTIMATDVQVQRDLRARTIARSR